LKEFKKNAIMRKFTNKERKQYNRYVDQHNQDEASGSGLCAGLAACCLIGGACTDGKIQIILFVLMIVFGIGTAFSGVHLNDPHRNINH